MKSRRPGVDGVVERVAADVVRGLEDAADGDLVGRARQRGQQVPLHLRSHRQRFPSASSLGHIAVAALENPRRRERRDDQIEVLRCNAVPHVVIQLEHADPVRSLHQRNRHRGRIRARCQDLIAGERPSHERAGNRLRGADTAAGDDLLEMPQGVVRDMEPGCSRSEQPAHQIEQNEHIARRYPHRSGHHSDQCVSVVRCHRLPLIHHLVIFPRVHGCFTVPDEEKSCCGRAGVPDGSALPLGGHRPRRSPPPA